VDVGFVGLGDLGLPMAQMISRAGHRLKVWARDDSTFDRFGEDAYEPYESPDALGAACDVVGVCVTADADLLDVLLERGLLGAMRPGSALLVHSTVAPSTCQRLADSSENHRVDILDAPVSGGRPEAYQRSLTMMVGGRRDAFDATRPVMESYAARAFHLCPLGSGLVCKLLNNGIGNAHKLLDMRLTALADDLGLDLDAFFEVLQGSSGGSWYTGTFHRYGWGVFPHTEKDVRLVEEILVAAGSPESELRALWRRSAEVVADHRQHRE